MLFEDTAPRQTSPPLQSHASPEALALIERDTAPRTTSGTSEKPATKLDMSESRGTLTEADRLDSPHLQHEAPAQRISSVNRHASPNLAALVPATNGVVQHTRGASKKTADVEKSKIGPQHRKKKADKADRPMPIVEVKPCLPNALAGMLKALNISRGCET